MQCNFVYFFFFKENGEILEKFLLFKLHSGKTFFLSIILNVDIVTVFNDVRAVFSHARFVLLC